MFRFPFLIVLLLLLSGCGEFFERLQRVGTAPPLRSPNERVQIPDVEFDGSVRMANSLWKPGSSGFFKRRAKSVGDIIRVNVEISDKAQLENESNQERKSKESLGIPKLFGAQEKLIDAFSGSDSKNSSSFLELQGSHTTLGKGAIDRSEKIHIQVAAMVSKVLPNGNMIIEGSQEVRVNYEVRAVILSGIVRAEDINADNTIEASKIAELRMSYGGRGHLSDVQQPRIGTQLLDILSPF